MIKATRLLEILAAGALVVACSSSKSSTFDKDAGSEKDASHKDGGEKDGARDGEGSMSLASLCTSALAAEAKVDSMCFGGPLASWQSTLEAGNPCGVIEGAVNAGTLKFNANEAAECLTAIAGASCTATSSSDGNFSACGMAFVGTVPAGGTCNLDLECSGDSFCSGLGGAKAACTGTCKARVGKGDPCVAGDECVDGYVCDKTDGGLACEPPATTAKSGEACGYSATTKTVTACSPGLACNVKTLQCQTPVAEGSACVAGQQECAPFTYCDPTTKKCTGDPGAGGHCGAELDEDPIACLAPSYCKVTSMMSTYFAGTCAAPEAAGSACQVGSDCASARCEIGDGGKGTCLAACTGS
jgi:hypothetical protein